jgi:cyanophycin synthetase
MNHYQSVLDYGHNYDGYESTIQCLKAIHPNRIIGIIGVPGDRLDEDIYDIGIISGQSFDKIIIKEDRLLRDRKTTDVATILYKAAIAGGINPQQVEIILDEEKALMAAIESANEGDCIVMFYEEFEPAIEIINNFKVIQKQSVRV